MQKIKEENIGINGRLHLPLQPVRVSKEELAASRAGTLGCFPSADLYDPEDAPTEQQLVPLNTRRHGVTHAKSSN